MFDKSVGNARHLGCDSSQRLALAVRLGRIILDVTLVFVAEAVLTHPDGDGGGKPEGKPQASITTLGKPLLTFVLA